MFERTGPPDVLILGGGIAGLETLMALEHLAGERVRLTIVSAGDVQVPVAPVAAGHGARALTDVAVSVDPVRHRVSTATGSELAWDILVVAVGAGRAGTDHFGGTTGSLAVVVPPDASWTLPAYELALRERALDPDVPITVVSTESSPLELFGTTPCGHVARLLDAADIAFVGDAYTTVDDACRLTIRPGERELVVSRALVVAHPKGPFLAGLPHDPEGFIPVDRYGCVLGVPDVYAAGGCTPWPVREGELAAQQADVVAAHIGHRLLGSPATDPFRPALRGTLTAPGGDELHMRHRLTGGAGDGECSRQRRFQRRRGTRHGTGAALRRV